MAKSHDNFIYCICYPCIVISHWVIISRKNNNAPAAFINSVGIVFFILSIQILNDKILTNEKP